MGKNSLFGYLKIGFKHSIVFLLATVILWFVYGVLLARHISTGENINFVLLIFLGIIGLTISGWFAVKFKNFIYKT